MSGIAGIIHFDGRPVEPGQVEAMTAAMHYRGPDGINHWRRGAVALGQCMLRTTPESLEENQPLVNEDESLVLVMDGRVDNWEELRQELIGRGAVLRTRADAELVLRAYEVWGRKCVEHVDGDFALVVWDARRREAFCARDRVGNKPFNYHWNGSTLVFASDVHAVLSLPWVPEVVNEELVAEHLSTEWQTLHETFWRGIFRLAASHFMTVNAEGPAHQEYWSPDLAATLHCRSDEEYIEHYRELFIDVVRRMSRSNNVLACEVSGGLDSSAIFGVAEMLRKRDALPAPGVEGYTLAFRGDAFADEHFFSEAVANHVGRPLREVAPGRFPLSWYQDFATTFKDFPGFPNWTMLRSIHSEARKLNCRTLLSGTGGDEWVGGAENGYAVAVRNWDLRAVLQILQNNAHELGRFRSLWDLIREGLVPMLPRTLKKSLRGVSRSVGLTREINYCDWLTPNLVRHLREKRTCTALPSVGTGSPAQNIQLQRLRSPIILFGREMSERQAAHSGLERRQPFWSARLVEAAFATPDRFRIRHGEDKWLHKRAMHGILPDVLLGRKGKADFFTVYSRDRDKLIRAVTEEIVDRRTAWVDSGKLRAAFKQRNGDTSIRQDLGLWSLLMADALAHQSQGA